MIDVFELISNNEKLHTTTLDPFAQPQLSLFFAQSATNGLYILHLPNYQVLLHKEGKLLTEKTPRSLPTNNYPLHHAFLV